MNTHLIEKARQIRCLICDLDGVLTDGYIYMNEKGEQSRRFHVHDGMGIKLLLHAGIEVALITTTQGEIISKRIEQLGIKYYFTGQKNKLKAYETLKSQLEISDLQCAYIGDDLPDLDILKQVNLSFTVKDGVPEIKGFVDAITQKPGGKGAVREVANLILHAQGRLDASLEHYYGKHENL